MYRKCFKQNDMNTIHSEESSMAKCPVCGKEVKNAKKTWKMAGKPDKKGKRTQLTIGLYECCDKTFREVLDKKKI
jgi:DNA repair exonuclease SbcCD ATPase subunit